MPNRFSSRLGEFDLRERLAPVPGWVTEIVFALCCISAAAAARLVFNLFAPATAPFALIFPPVLAATLFAGWRSGALTLILSELGAWYFVLNGRPTFTLRDPNDGPRMILIAIAATFVVILAEMFRAAVKSAVRLRNAQVEERDLLLREVDHRMRNNFTLVFSLLDMQRRRAVDPAAKEALNQVMSRVESISRAHRSLYRDASGVRAVRMKDYLHDLCEALADTLALRGAVTLHYDICDAVMERDRAVLLGLITNELVTNASKHAFVDREHGAIEVAFAETESGWRLVVKDNGVGMRERSGPAAADSGLGHLLVEAFARQAKAALSSSSGENGTAFALDIEP